MPIEQEVMPFRVLDLGRAVGGGRPFIVTAKRTAAAAIELPLLPTWNSKQERGTWNMNDEVETNQHRCSPADDAVPVSRDGESDPPQPLALLPDGDSGPPVATPIQQEQLASGEEEVEVHESALCLAEEDSDRAPIPIQQQEQQLDDAKRKAKAEISTAIGARGRDERDSTTGLVAEERDEDLKPSARSRVGASLGELDEEAVPSMSAPRQRSGPSLCLSDCDGNDPPVPIQQQVQMLALDDKAVKNKMKQEAKAEEQKSVMSFVEEASDSAPIPIQQQMHQFDDAKEKPTSEISTASGVSERDSTTELVAEEMEEDKVQPRPSVRSGASLEELEAFVELSSMPTPRNDAAHARLAPEEIPIYNGIVVPTERTRFQTWAEHFRDNYKSIIGLMILAIASAVTVGIVLDRRRNNIPNMDILEPPVDPADLQFDPDDTTGILGMDMLPPGSEGSEQSPTDPSSSEVKYDPTEEELQMQEILKLEAEQNKAMMPEGWDPNNPKASLDAFKDQNTVPSEETELGASMSEEEAYQGVHDDPIFDDPMYDPNSPEFDEAALAELDEESLSILAEKYGDDIMDKLPNGPPLEEEPIENEFDPANPMYDPSSPEFDEAALGELDQESLATLADMYGDEITALLDG